MLYKEFIKRRTKEEENRYNTKLMRHNKKMKYIKLPDKNRSDVKNTWRVLKEMIRKNQGKINYPHYFYFSNVMMKDNE